MHLPSLTQHQLLVFWTQLLVLLAVARGCGTLLRRFGQPAVVGQLLAGVLLGPSVLGHLWPAAEQMIAPAKAADAAAVNAVAWLGVGLLLVLAGFDTDLALVRRLGRPSAAVAVGGLALPMAAGALLALVMPRTLMGAHASTTAFVLFIALAMSISSLPVIAKILDELGFMRRNFGQMTVAVGMVNDLVGWLGLGVVAAVGAARHLDAASLSVPIVAIAVVLLIAAAVGQRSVDALLRLVRRTQGNETDAVSAVVLVAFAVGVVMQAVRSDAVLGTYIAGILVGRSRFFQRGTRQHLESMTMGVFAPIFFATAGLRMDLGGLGRHSALAWAGIVLAVAVASKVGGVLVSAATVRMHRREGLALALGLNCRGAVEIVIATVGLSIGVLSQSAYTIIVLMAIVTSVVAPPLLRAVVRDWKGTPEERARLGREETTARNLFVRPGRMLVALEPGQASLDAARVAHMAWPEEASATVLALGGFDVDEDELAMAMPGRDVEVRAAEGPSA
ncbi:MAG TPA: cation:proton antiporter, partial [Acidimicrobiales bacterium]|nr:cation:proton antiporter [Acidimicrobiales bacterium]